MSRARPWLLLLTLTACAAPLLLAPGEAQEPPAAAPEPPPPPAGPEVVVMAAGESLGHLEPCNCVAGMQGGFPRRLSALGRARREVPALVALDTGDLSAGDQHHPRLLVAKTRAALELLARAEVAAVAVGELDLRIGWEALRREGERARAPLLLANARLPGVEGPAGRPFPAARALELGPGRTALVAAALDPELGDPTGQLELGPPDPALREALAAAPPGALRVVLFHGTREAALEQLREDLPADVIVCGHGQQEARPLARHGQALVVETLRDARALARLRLAPGVEPTLTQVPLGGDVPDDPWARERVDAYYAEVKDLPEPPRKPVPEGGSFLGAESCRACHPEQYELFAASKHHGAQARVAARDPKRAGLTECTRCHVTGWGYTGGFESLEATPHLGEVGCEACHGVGEAHMLAPPDQKRGYGVRTGFPAAWKETCLGCHDPSNSPGFEFEKAMQAIRHWRPR